MKQREPGCFTLAKLAKSQNYFISVQGPTTTSITSLWLLEHGKPSSWPPGVQLRAGCIAPHVPFCCVTRSRMHLPKCCLPFYTLSYWHLCTFNKGWAVASGYSVILWPAEYWAFEFWIVESSIQNYPYLLYSV